MTRTNMRNYVRGLSNPNPRFVRDRVPARRIGKWKILGNRCV
jgi:hypothetical protein